MSRFACLLLLFLVPILVAAQPKLGPYNSLSIKDGLSHSSVAFMFRDSRGFMWLSSIDGLNRFDGRAVRTYRPKAEEPNSLLGSNIQSHFFEEKSSGNLWFSTWNAVQCYRRATDDFVHFRLKDSHGKPYLEGYHVVFRDSEGWLWVHLDDASVASGGILYRFEPKSGRQIRVGELGGLRFRADTSATGAVRRVFGWHITEAVGLEILSAVSEGSAWRREVFFDGKNNLPATKIFDCLLDSKQHLWLTTKLGLVKFEPETAKFELFSAKNQSNDKSFFGLVAADERFLICSTRGSGLYIFDRLLGQFSEHIQPETNQENGLANIRNDDLYLDPTGTLWVSQWTKGVQYCQLDKRKFENLHIERSFPMLGKHSYFLQSIVADNRGRVWVATDKGDIFSIAADTRKVIHIPFAEQTATRMATDISGRVWLMTVNNLYVFDEKSARFRPVLGKKLDKPMYFRCLVQRANGQILVGTDKGLFELQPSKSGDFSPQKVTTDPSIKSVEHLFEDANGSLWIDANYSTLKYWSRDGRHTNFDLGESRDLCLALDKKSAYVATDNGLVHINLQKLTYETINESNGLPNQYLYAVRPDQKGRLWLTSNRGIVVYEPATKACWQYSRFDGVWEEGFFSDVAVQLSSGEIWAGNRQVINIFDPNRLPHLTNIASVKLTGIHINDAQTSVVGAVSEFTSWQLTHDSSTVTFHFAALDFSDPAATQFRYFLEGYDHDTIQIIKGGIGTARYAQLPPGSYTFNIWAANSDGIWNPVPHKIALRVWPAWYQTWWFRLLVLAAVVGAVWWLARNRTLHLLALQRAEIEKKQILLLERERIARDMHDDLGSGLSALQILSNLTKNKTTDPNLRVEIEKIANSSAQLNQNIREIIWTINTQDDSLGSLIYFLRRFCADFEELTNLDIRLQVADELPDIKLSGEQRRNLFLCIKEALNNTAKYAEATKIRLEITVNKTEIAFTVADNGKGFDIDEAYKKAGNGLRNIQSRMKDISGYAQFKCENGETKVVLVLGFTS